MCRPVITHKTAPVEAEYNRQIREAYIMDDLVKCPLEKGGVDRDKGLKPSVASPAANVTACCSAIPHQESVKEFFCEFIKARTFGMAAVMAKILLSIAASSTMVSPKTLV